MGDGNEAWKPALDAGCNKNCSCRSFGKEYSEKRGGQDGKKTVLGVGHGPVHALYAYGACVRVCGWGLLSRRLNERLDGKH